MLNVRAGARVQVREEHDRGYFLTKVRTPPGTVLSVQGTGVTASVFVKLDSGETMPFRPGELEHAVLADLAGRSRGDIPRRLRRPRCHVARFHLACRPDPRFRACGRRCHLHSRHPPVPGVSQLATVYYLVPVNATQEGSAYNPTSDAVAMAFMPTPTQGPEAGDWATGSWDTAVSDILYPYRLKCLIGPSGTVTLGIGRYVVYARIADSPETFR